MRCFNFALLLVLSLHIAASTPGQRPGATNQGSPSQTTEEELKRLDRSLDDAFLRGDKKTFERVLGDEMIAVSSQGDVARKKDILSQISLPPPELKLSIVAEDVQVFLFGDTAIVSSRKTIKQQTRDGSFSDQVRDTNTYVRRADRWQLIASQQSKLPPPYAAKEVSFDLEISDASIRGSENAKVVMVEFSDYQCPLCRGFVAETFKQIEKEYIDSGKVAFLVRQTPLSDIHPDAFKAAEAALCSAAQQKFWEMNDRLFQEPMALKVIDLVAHAQALQLDISKFRECLADERTTAAVQEQLKAAAKMGLQGTPNFLIGVKEPTTNKVKVLRMIQGAQPYNVFKVTLDSVFSL